MIKAHIVTKYVVEYGNEFNAQDFIEALDRYLDDTDLDYDDLLYSYPEYPGLAENGLYEFEKKPFNEFADWANEKCEKNLADFINELRTSNNDDEYVRIELW